MTDLVGFLRARLDEDEQIARDGAMRRGPDWFLREEPPPAWGGNWPDPEIIAGGKPIVCCDEEQGGHLVAEHIARHDPARVLADVAMKRELVRLHGPMSVLPGSQYFNDAHLTREPMRLCLSCEPEKMFRRERSFPCRTLRALAEPYADHPDYRQEWNP